MSERGLYVRNDSSLRPYCEGQSEQLETADYYLLEFWPSDDVNITSFFIRLYKLIFTFSVQFVIFHVCLILISVNHSLGDIRLKFYYLFSFLLYKNVAMTFAP